MSDDEKGYPEFLDDMGKLLTASLPRVDRERDDLADAEADLHRLRTQVANAKKRRDLARQRYDLERGTLMEIFTTWKSEVMALRTEGETPVREIPEVES